MKTHLVRTTLKKELVGGTHRLSNASRLYVKPCGDRSTACLMCFSTDALEYQIGPVMNSWFMTKDSVRELIDLLTEVHDAMSDENDL